MPTYKVYFPRKRGGSPVNIHDEVIINMDALRTKVADRITDPTLQSSIIDILDLAEEMAVRQMNEKNTIPGKFLLKVFRFVETAIDSHRE